MEQIILIVHLLVALAIIGLIMLQQGKGADMGASFGAGASQTLFGSDGSGNILTRATAYLVVAFFATSFGLAVIANNISAPSTDLDFELPEAAVEQAPVDALAEDPITSDLPVINEDLPEAALVGEEIPAADALPEDTAEDDVPQL